MCGFTQRKKYICDSERDILVNLKAYYSWNNSYIRESRIIFRKRIVPISLGKIQLWSLVPPKLKDFIPSRKSFK